MNSKELEDLLTGKIDKAKNVIESLIKIMSTPVAKREGVVIPAKECEVWVKELNQFLQNNPKIQY